MLDISVSRSLVHGGIVLLQFNMSNQNRGRKVPQKMWGVKKFRFFDDSCTPNASINALRGGGGPQLQQ